MNGLQILVSWLANAAQFLGQAEWIGALMLGLGMIFSWSGVAKLRQPVLTALAIADFGVIKRASRWMGLGLGGFEFALGSALITRVWPQTILIITGGLLWIFVILIAISLWRGQTFACFCFGDLSDTLSRFTLWRTAGMAGGATFAVFAIEYPSTYPLTEFGVQWLMAAAMLGIILVLYGIHNINRQTEKLFASLAIARETT